MNIEILRKQNARLGVCILAMSILFVPERANEPIPMPVLKPILVSAPIRSYPFNAEPSKESVVAETQAQQPNAVSTYVANLFSTNGWHTTPTKGSNEHGFHPLSAEQSKLYARIFMAQADGDIKAADDLMARLHDKRLIGHVLYQRYMHPAYTTKYSDLKNWMANYAEYPDADKIYKLAVSRGGAEGLTKPKVHGFLSRMGEPTVYRAKRYKPTISRDQAQENSVNALIKDIKSLVRGGNTLDALKKFHEVSLENVMDTVERDRLQGKIAAGFLYRGRIDAAYKLASQSSDRSGLNAPEAAWISGLALWHKGDYARASAYFERAGRSEYASGWLASAGSYWAARCYDRTKNTSKYKASLKNAAEHSHTFYGILAARALNANQGFYWAQPEYTHEHESLILSSKAGQRAVSLVAAGQYALAENELMRLNYKNDKALQEAVLAYASHVDLPGVALRLGNMVQAKNGKYYDSALYPVSPWAPQDGYKLDPALVHAVIRQESRFNYGARSYAGAEGLMQVMPKTAQYIAQRNSYTDDLNLKTMRSPEMNIKVGQDYLDYLLKGDDVQGNIVSLLVAYNAGPGNLNKWRKAMGESDDMLLFIEMLPSQETRDYVERVLSNYWIYRLRAGLKLPTLTAMIKGDVPKYAYSMQYEYAAYKLASNQ